MNTVDPIFSDAARGDGSSGVESILDYLHDAAGFAIGIKPNVPLERALGRGALMPQNEEDALGQLKEAVAEIGCTVVRRGQSLTIVTDQDAKKQFLPLPQVPSGGNLSIRS
ncbi:MAG TPA: hypothetical protein VEH04_07345 [Verrucomicrobiae bacterium]|nr:hypothetical protein [Verrucomicrobiae bacterium]